MFDDKDRIMFPDYIPEELEEAPIDAAIKESIVKINKSTWVRTIYSCQGHRDRKTGCYAPPYVVFVYHKKHIKNLLYLIHKSSFVGKRSIEYSIEGWHYDIPALFDRKRYDRFKLSCFEHHNFYQFRRMLGRLAVAITNDKQNRSSS